MTDQAHPDAHILLFVGLQASGKTSFYRTRFAETHVHVSRDNFRHNRNPSRRQLVLIEEGLRAGRPVVLDNTNPTPEDRAPVLALARTLKVSVIGYFFESVLADCLARNQGRQGVARVPAVALHATLEKLSPPSLSEGFAKLHRVRMDGAGGWVVEEWEGPGSPDLDSQP